MDQRIAKRVVIGLGVAVVAGYGIYKGLSLGEMASNIRVTFAGIPKIHDPNPLKMKLSVDVRVDNPTTGRATVKVPSVQFFYKGRPLVNTAINDKMYVIEPVSSGKISGLIVETNIFKFFGKGILQDKNMINNIGVNAIAEVNGVPITINKI